MIEVQPLPVRFQAACALEKILTMEKARTIIKPKLDVILKCYLGLMHELDNEELVAAFESLMTIFQDDIGPYAAEICLHLRKQYQRLIAQDAQEDEGESILAAVASFTSIRRIIDAVQGDPALLLQVEDIIYPCLLHSLKRLFEDLTYLIRLQLLILRYIQCTFYPSMDDIMKEVFVDFAFVLALLNHHL